MDIGISALQIKLSPDFAIRVPETPNFEISKFTATNAAFIALK